MHLRLPEVCAERSPGRATLPRWRSRSATV